MARFAALDPRLDPYVGATNVERAADLEAGSVLPVRNPPLPGLSIIVLNLDAPELVRSIVNGFRFVSAHFEERGLRCELIVGDTGSTDPQTVELLELPINGMSVVRGLHYQFSKNNNELFGRVNYATTLFLNNDVLIDRNHESVLKAYDVHLRTGCIVSTVLDFEDGRLQHGGVDFLRDDRFYSLPYHPNAGTIATHVAGVETEWSAATGAFLMVDSLLFGQLGGFDEEYQAECQDVDLCLRARRLGVECRVVDVGPLVHLENATRPKGDENWADRRRFVRRWSSYIEMT